VRKKRCVRLPLKSSKIGRLEKINQDRQNPKEAFNYALKFAQGVIQAQKLDLDNIESSKVFDTIDTLKTWNQLEEAQDFAQIALKEFEKLNALGETPETLTGVAFANRRLGELAQANNDLDLALSYFKQSLVLFEQVNALGETPDTLRDVAFANEKLGDLARANDLSNIHTFLKWGVLFLIIVIPAYLMFV